MDLLEFKKRILPLNQKMYRYAYLLLKDQAEAEDAVQEVCLKLWKIRDSLEQYNSLEAYTIKVTRNWCLDRIKAKRPVYIESYTSGYDNADTEDPLRILENNDDLDLLFLILQKLPDQQRQVIQLRDIENREFEEIAEILDMKINAVRVNLSRARNKIREEMTKMNNK